jgi:hypothetical protein
MFDSMLLNIEKVSIIQNVRQILIIGAAFPVSLSMWHTYYSFEIVGMVGGGHPQETVNFEEEEEEEDAF